MVVLPRAADSCWFETHLRRMAGAKAHGNRKLTTDKLFMALLLSFFEPTARSLRRIEAQGDFGGRLALGPDLRRLARSTTADALAALDPRLLLPLIEDLQARCPGLCHDDPALHALTQRIIAADGTYFTVACDVAWALRHTKSDGKRQGQVRINVQLDTASWCPQVVTVSGQDGHSEAAAFMPDLLPDALYVVDRNFVVFPFLRKVLELGGQFIVRARATAPTLEVSGTHTLRPADAEAGVVADESVRLTGVYARRDGLGDRTFRRGEIKGHTLFSGGGK